MSRKYIECRAPGCTIRMSAADEKELVDAVLSHTVIFHKTQDTPEFRERIRQAVRDEAPVG